MNCDFCEKPEVQERAIFQNNLVKVFPTNIPIVPGHVIVCPVRCVAKVDELMNDEWQALRETIVKFKAVLTQLYGAEGFNVAWNEGDLAGQSIPHLHIHLLPRKTGDTGILEYEPRKFLYRPGSRSATPETELADISEQIKQALESV